MMDTSWIGPAVQSADAARANVWRVQEARHAERFSAYQANTGWQRGVADMRAAGLNPMLAFSEGPAPSPTGIAAPITDSQIGGAINSALSQERLKMDLRMADAAIDKTKQETDESSTREAYIASQHLLNKYMIDKVQEETNQVRLNSAFTAYSLPRARNLASVEGSKFGESIAYADRVLQALGLGSKAVRDLSH